MQEPDSSQTAIVHAVEQIEMGVSLKDVARKYRVCENTVTRAARSTKV